MMDRRGFVKGSMVTLGGSLLLDSCKTEAKRTSTGQRLNIRSIREQVPAFETPSYRGEQYEDWVPETLDLAERARISVNALTGAADPAFRWETDQTTHLDHRPPYMSWRANGPCLQKPIHALPMMRVMSGSTQNSDVDMKMVEAITRDIDNEGLWWLKVEGYPWRAGVFDGDQVWPVAQGRLMEALLTWHKYDGSPHWLKMVERLSRGLQKIAIRYQDRAWYYTGYTRSGWREHVNPFSGKQLHAKTMIFQSTGGEIQHATEEPAARPFFDIGLPLHGLACWYEASGEKPALNLARKLANFMLKPSMWGNGEGPTMAVAAQQAIWEGHFHTHTMGMMGLLEYAIAAKDYGLKQLVASFYEYARNFGIARIGFFPAVIGPLKQRREAAAQYGGPGSTGQCDESCAVADMTWLAVRMSEAGIGDYWDHVEQYVRNHLVEHQMLRRDLLEEIIASGPEHTIDPSMETAKDVIERGIGIFASGSDPTMAYAWGTMCCIANSPVALYEAWSSIVRYSNGVARVNLLLNRASPWLDVDSYLPYEGKVVLKNKTARVAYVRIPQWVDRKAVRCRINQKIVASRWLNQYLMVGGLAPRDMVTIEFPLVETEEEYTELTYERKYTCRFRGNTLVDISPREKRPDYTQMGSDDGATFPVKRGYPLYQRDFYRRDKAPIKKVQRYVVDKLV